MSRTADGQEVVDGGDVVDGVGEQAHGRLPRAREGGRVLLRHARAHARRQHARRVDHLPISLIAWVVKFMLKY